jgi:hypothetical protein
MPSLQLASLTAVGTPCSRELSTERRGFMHLSDRETWALIHGMILGAAFLLAFGGGFAGFYSLKPGLLTVAGVRERTRRLILGTWVMAAVAWATVITGSWIVYPWYRDAAASSPKSILLADPSTADWHTFGMEWKEHIAWIAPILATAVAFSVTYYGPLLIKHQGVRRALMVTFVAAFLTAGVAGLFGALITKSAPVS